jgi:hypothetical protein
MEKHRAYFELLDKLDAGPGCPICLSVHNALDSYLNGYLEEGVTDEQNWGALKAAEGWCGRHARQLGAKADGLAVALFYGHLIEEAEAALHDTGSKLARVRALLGADKKAPCPGCQREHESEAGQAHLVAAAAAEPEAQARMEPNLQLCVPHLRLCLRRADGPALAFLREDQGAKLKALRGELELYVRKTGHNDAHAREALGPEADSWKRALKRWYGLQWGDLSP